MADSVRYKNKLNSERVFEFLVGLDRELDDMKGKFLN